MQTYGLTRWPLATSMDAVGKNIPKNDSEQLLKAREQCLPFAQQCEEIAQSQLNAAQDKVKAAIAFLHEICDKLRVIDVDDDHDANRDGSQ